MAAVRPVCFVIMPFGKKKDPAGGPDIDFDRIYQDGVRPGIEGAGMEPVRADQERSGGIIHKPMFERLLLCEYAVADLTTANANVFYEVGIRHAVRRATTLPIFARQQALPFDVNFLRALPYDLAPQNGFGPEHAAALRAAVAERLGQLRSEAQAQAAEDSPLFQLLREYQAPNLSHLKTDLFRKQLDQLGGIQRQLADLRDRQDKSALQAMVQEVDIDHSEPSVLMDLFLSLRALSLWPDMVALYQRMPAVLKRDVTVREQLGFAQNRAGDRLAAIRTLEQVIQDHRATPENCGILGRVYKDLWSDARQAGQDALAQGYLQQAIDTYLRGFRADWRDAYPGINAVTLLDIQGDTARRDEVLPVVRFAVQQRLGEKPDYWDLATMLELAVLAEDGAAAQQRLGPALVAVKEGWQAATTANNLKLLLAARRARGVDQPWLAAIIAALEQRAGS